jgi:hypothetical protein
MRIYLFLAAAFLVLVSKAVANNNFFLPGDAFFPTQLTAEDLRELQTGEAAGKVFRYSSFGGYEGAFCGYAGYSRAQIAAVDRSFITNLVTVYGEIRQYERKELVEVVEKGKTKQLETNGIRVLFYPQDFDLTKFKLGLQYNEKWVDETIKFGHERQRIRLCELIDDKEAVIASWRDASLVGSFDLVLPKVKLDAGPPVEEPVNIKGPMKAIVLQQHTLKEYFNAGKTYRTIYVVNSKEVQQFEWSEYQWNLSEDEK